MQSWLNWYSTGLEIRHPERVSGFESLALRYAQNYGYMPGKGTNMFNMPTIDLVATGNNITKLRVAAGLTVRDLQDIFGFATPQAIYKWQHGTAMPTLDNLVVLAAVFGVALDDIIVVNKYGQVA